ncbi:DNA polymerase III subunit [Alicyclobacillus dauci]|uniref:DNA polymerase-3 subunit delta n=1 Tax=Alicyclobacillus dauci TaxID=1475485 RepID=A0ABY6Z4R2_9BACL|nr:hypothetical protein [Alicyclobacillus dauci]WAH37311.1 hypothetical protein NZD86_01830 [Alicyclobacillus dauci]
METLFRLSSVPNSIHLPTPLRDALTSGRLPHAVLLIGTPTATENTARYIAQTLLCESDTRPCGTCSSCVKFAADVQTDFFQLGGQSIKTAEVEEMQSWLKLRGHTGKKVYALYGAERLTGVAANRMLKTLEEPEEHVYALLTASLRQSVLSTIRSRSFTYTVHDSTSWLDTDHQSIPLLQALMANTENSSFEGFIDKMLKWTEMWVVERQPALILAAKWQSFCDDEISARISLMLLVEWIRDILHVRVGGSNIRFGDWNTQLSRIAPILEVKQWADAMEIVLESRQRLESHVASLLNFEQMCIRLREVLT